MTYRVEWSGRAKERVAEFYKQDPEGVDQLFDAVGSLALEPRPVGARQFGSPDILRIHVGRYRLMYEVSDMTVTITIAHAGQVS